MRPGQAADHVGHGGEDGDGQQDGEAPAVRLAQALIEDAARLGASDIHLEPEAGFVRIRYRIDGVLRPARSLRKAHWPPLLVRLKVMGGLNIAEQRAPQDGQLSMQVAGRTLDIRVACLPSGNGHFTARALARMYGALANGGAVGGTVVGGAVVGGTYGRVVGGTYGCVVGVGAGVCFSGTGVAAGGASLGGFSFQPLPHMVRMPRSAWRPFDRSFQSFGIPRETRT